MQVSNTLSIDKNLHIQIQTFVMLSSHIFTLFYRASTLFL